MKKYDSIQIDIEELGINSNLLEESCFRVDTDWLYRHQSPLFALYLISGEVEVWGVRKKVGSLRPKCFIGLGLLLDPNAESSFTYRVLQGSRVLTIPLSLIHEFRPIFEGIAA